MRMPAGRPGCGYAQVALLHSKAPTLPPDVLRHQPPEKNNLVRNDLLEGTSRRSRDEILEAAGHHAHVTRRTQGPTAKHMRHGRAGGCRKAKGTHWRRRARWCPAGPLVWVTSDGQWKVARGHAVITVDDNHAPLPSHVRSCACPRAVPGAGTPKWRSCTPRPPPYRPMFSAISHPSPHIGILTPDSG